MRTAYKCRVYPSPLVVVDRRHPSSKTCSVCGHLLATLSLGTRHWTCPDCGTPARPGRQRGQEHRCGWSSRSRERCRRCLPPVLSGGEEVKPVEE
ncbi:zinc ribbon domain-containing protein [Plantactinospora sp. KLBMP9567]|uniref:zinc ribbon domain-containing protein n=1 Tax=Plantactinospora sp. KLBMP9567 TaxID=3085900 RepID=UPI003990859D